MSFKEYRSDKMKFSEAHEEPIIFDRTSSRRRILMSAMKAAAAGTGVALASGAMENPATAAAAGFVDLYSDQTIDGVKRFTSPPQVPASSFPQSAVSGLAEALAGTQPLISPGTFIQSSMVQRQSLERTAIFKFTPAAVDNEPFDIQMSSSANLSPGTGFNNAMFFGWNAELYAGGPGVAKKPAIVMGFEDNYFDDSGDMGHGTEWYVEHSNPGEGAVFLRPFYTRTIWDGPSAGTTVITHDLGTKGSQRIFLVKAGTGGAASLFSVDPTAVQCFRPLVVSGSTIFLTSPIGQARVVLNGKTNSSLTFQINNTSVWYLQGESPSTLRLRDANSRTHVEYVQGSSPALASTELLSNLKVGGRLVVGSAILNPAATDGFMYIPACSGSPTGTPVSQTGTVPMVYDTLNNLLMVYNSGWRAIPAGPPSSLLRG